MAVEGLADSDLWINENTTNPGVYSFSYPQLADAAEQPGALAIIVLTARASGSFEYEPTSITVGGVEAAFVYARAAASGTGAGSSHLVVIACPLAAVQNTTVEFVGGPVGLENDVVVQGGIYINVDSSFNLVTSAVLVDGDNPIGPVSVVEGGAVVAAGCHYGVSADPEYQSVEDSTAYEMYAGGDLEYYNNGESSHRQGFGHRLGFTADAEESASQTVSASAYSPGVIFALPPLTDTPVVATCEEFGRATRAYVSAYDRSRVHQSRLYRFEKRCLVANFNGAIPSARTIVSAVWRTDAPYIGVMSSPLISANQRETTVLLQTQLGGWMNVRAEVTLDNGEIYNQAYRVNVREAGLFNDDPALSSGPFSVSVSV